MNGKLEICDSSKLGCGKALHYSESRKQGGVNYSASFEFTIPTSLTKQIAATFLREFADILDPKPQPTFEP